MTTPADSPERLNIKKYPNRRFYDTTRSCHVTLSDLHNLINEGYDVSVMDSSSGSNITNLVLTQIIMEHDPPKLEFFPPNILHQVIRTQQQMLDTVFEQFFRQMVEAHKASQAQWSRFLQNTLGLGFNAPTNPMEWTQAMMNALMPQANRHDASGDRQSNDAELRQLRSQVAELTQRVEDLSDAGKGE